MPRSRGADNICPRDCKVTPSENADLATVIHCLKLPQDQRYGNRQTQFQYLKSIPEIVRVPQAGESIQVSWYVSLQINKPHRIGKYVGIYHLLCGLGKVNVYTSNSLMLFSLMADVQFVGSCLLLQPVELKLTVS